jgi:putative peptidoglycan lipid II flippase
VFLSRVLGFARDWVLAHQVGSNALTDAYNAAFTIPDILNYLLAGGALSVTFLPVFLEYFTAGRKEEAWRVFSIVLNFTCTVLAALTIVAEIFAPVLTRLTAPDFSPEQAAITTRLTRIMLPAQACFFIGGVLSAVQYAQGRFLIPSLAPLIYNGMTILFGALFARSWGVDAFSWGILAGSLLGNCLLQVYGARRLGARFSFDLDLAHPGFLRFLRMSVPIMLGFSIIFVDDWAIRWFGSALEPGAISWLSYAKRLMLVVVALFGQAAGVAAYPILARLAAQKKWGEMHASLEDALRHVMLAIIPASVLLALVSRPIVYILYSRTRLSASDIEQTALVMELFLIAAAAWGTQTIIGRGFYALGDTLTPTIVGSALTLASIPIYWFGREHHGHMGLAMASSIAVMLYTAVLWMILYRRLRASVSGMASYFLRAAGCAGVAAMVALGVRQWLAAYFVWQSLRGSAVYLVLVSTAFVAVFLPLARVARLASWRDVAALLPRRSAGKPPA